ncbi:MAG: hypothetical protein ABIG32_03530 [Candidatus Uhrbacteria bacterium]
MEIIDTLISKEFKYILRQSNNSTWALSRLDISSALKEVVKEKVLAEFKRVTVGKDTLKNIALNNGMLDDVICPNCGNIELKKKDSDLTSSTDEWHILCYSCDHQWKLTGSQILESDIKLESTYYGKND